MRRLVGVGLIGLLVLCIKCTSDQELVSSSLASRHYHAGRFLLTCCSEQRASEDGGTPTCVKVIESNTCAAYGHAVDAQVDEVGLANDAHKFGKLPKEARSNLKAANKASAAAGGKVKNQ